jgi:large subunit ribosomal protein L6
MDQKTAKQTKEIIKYDIELPQGLEVLQEGNKLTVRGQKGTVIKLLAHPMIKVKKEANKISLASQSTTRKNKRMINTLHAHILNLFRGAKEGFVYTLKICSGHFPISVKQEGTVLVISNFLGEKIPRKAKILPGVKVVVNKDKITVEGTDIELTGQTAANIEIATTIKNRDRRVFQDGIYITEKPARVQA